MFNFSIKGLIAVVIGLILTVGGIFKASVIGYYPSETIPMFGAILVGVALLWYANRFGRVDTGDGDKPAPPEAQLDRDPS